MSAGIGSQFYDIVDIVIFVPGGSKPGENHSDRPVWEKHLIAQVEPRFIGVSSNDSTCRFRHLSIVSQYRERQDNATPYMPDSAAHIFWKVRSKNWRAIAF